MTMPQDWPTWIGDAVEAGADVTITSEAGGSEAFAADTQGAGQNAVGDDLRVTVDGSPMLIDAALGRAESGSLAVTARGKAVTLDQATPIIAGGGVLCLLGAGFCLYRRSIKPSLVLGAIGLGLIAGAYQPWLFLLALLGVLGGVVWGFRDSLALSDARRALVASVSEHEQEHSADGIASRQAFEERMRNRIGGDKHAKAEIKRAKERG